MKNIAISTLLFLSTIAFSCPGGQEIELNDDKVLTAFSLYKKSTDTHFMFSEDLRGRDFYSYTIGDSQGETTHRISLEGVNRSIVVTVEDSEGEVKKYQGQSGRMRGCNDIVEIQ